MLNKINGGCILQECYLSDLNTYMEFICMYVFIYYLCICLSYKISNMGVVNIAHNL